MKNEKLEKQASSEIAQSRERFEKWANNSGLSSITGSDANMSIALWQCWQMAERDTRERVAQIVEDEDIDELIKQPFSLAEIWQALAERIRGKE